MSIQEFSKKRGWGINLKIDWTGIIVLRFAIFLRHDRDWFRDRTEGGYITLIQKTWKYNGVHVLKLKFRLNCISYNWYKDDADLDSQIFWIIELRDCFRLSLN